MEHSIFPVQDEWKKRAYADAAKYKAMYAESLADPDAFWAKQAEEFVWKKKWSKVKDTNFISPVSIKWFEGGLLNLSENCLDRHLAARGSQTAIIWESDGGESKHITYGELHEEVCRFANVLKKNGAKKGDRITLYMPMVPEAAVAMLACARIGAVHSVVFGGFSAEALKGRIEDCNSKIVITADEGLRGGKKIGLKATVDEAIKGLANVETVLVVKRTGGQVAWNARDRWWHEEMQAVTPHCEPETMEAEDPLFILYTSGSTGKPKGVLHTTGGYMVWAGMTHKYVFDYHTPSPHKPAQAGALRGPVPDSHQTPPFGGDREVYWCTADIGWITGHTYTLYGPLLNGAITLMFEGIPSYPDPSRFWQVVDKHQVNIFYTAPTAIRAMMRDGDHFVTGTSRKSLKLLASVGEPINPEAWKWYYEVVGGSRCPVVDTWWQTETGGHMITPLPGATDLKPGSATLPFFGVQPAILDAQGKEQQGECEGVLCMKDSWPGQARTLYGDHARFEKTYFSDYPGYYFSGDGARRDADGYYWITGRVDDVLKISGHRLGTADIESALVGHAHVTEAAVVGYPHDIKGQGIYCYVTLAADALPAPELEKELVQWVRKTLGPVATPDYIHFTPALPKTRSGKIMRRILRKIAEGDTESLGDISTLTNPEIVAELVKRRRN